MKYYIARNLQEAETIVNLLQGHPDISAGWTDWKFIGGYPLVINVEEGFHCPQCGSDEYEDGDVSTIKDLLALSLNGWVEPRWKPDVDQEYYVPSLNSEPFHYSEINTGNASNVRCFERGLYYSNRDEAIARAKNMMKANDEFIYEKPKHD